MKFFTSTLLVNRLLTATITLSVYLFAGNAVASNGNNTLLNTNPAIAAGIEYASLTAGANDKAVFINWVTASEQNNSHFEVERSLDMKVFTTVAMVLDGFSTTGTSGKSYKFKEAAGEVKKGKTVYYRLKQIDNDNKVNYSSIMAVQMNSTVTVFPTTEPTNITINSKEIATTVAKGIYPSGQTLLSKQTVTGL